MTIIEQLIVNIRQAATYNRHDLVPPTVILWPDGERLWEKVIPILLDAMPELYVLDENECTPRRGPSPQIRYLISRNATGAIPVIYLPGVSKLSFKGIAGFPEKARHLFALQFQGEFWIQKNHKDWTPLAFLSSDSGGLGLDIARDQATSQAIAEQLESILRTKSADLRGRTIEAADLHGLIARDPESMLLKWMAEPEKTWANWSIEQKNAFTSICLKEFGFSPEKDGVLTAVEKMVRESDGWEQVWNRFQESPQAYGGIRKIFEQIHPQTVFDAQNYKFPQNNTAKEDELRKELLKLGQYPASMATDVLVTLFKEHGSRVTTVWAALGEASLAKALVWLNQLVEAGREGMTGSDWYTLRDSYIKSGWKVDRAAWKALSTVRTKNDIEAIQTALRAVYKPWLEDLADHTNVLSPSYPNASVSHCATRIPVSGTVILFVDGLRSDLGFELSGKLSAEGYSIEIDNEWAVLPTVTATNKPAWQPLAGKLVGAEISEAFEPQVLSTGHSLKTADFRKQVTETGWIWFDANTAGDPSGSGWTEIGVLDHNGHELGAKLAWRIEEELLSAAQRVQELFTNGWKKIIIVTDHGWLLLPGGLPKVDFPKHLSISRWGRTAIALPGAVHGFKEVPWFWGGGHSIVCAPGISAFKDGLEYSHGGITLQETLIPVISVTRPVTETALVRIVSYKWTGLRLQVMLENAGAECRLDLRTKTADAATSVISESQRQKSVGPDGGLSLVVEDDSRMGQSAVLVAEINGKVVAKQPLTIGEN